MSRPALGPTQPHFQWISGFWGSFLRVKQLEYEVDESPSSGAKVKNEWSFISAPLICLHGMDRENLYFFKQIDA
jgi:hypothetical protein